MNECLTEPVGEWGLFRAFPEFNNIELLHAHYIRHCFSPHVHKGYAFGVIEQGVEQLALGGKEKVTLPAGSIVALNPGQLHSGQAAVEEGWTYRMFYVPKVVVQNIFEKIEEHSMQFPYFPNTVIKDESLFNIMLQAHQALLDPVATKLEKQIHLLNSLSTLISRHTQAKLISDSKKHNDFAIRQVVEYIDAHFQEDITLDMIANLAGMSRYHLCREFKQLVGMPPNVYQIHRRIETSKERLKRGESLIDIALGTGFYDQSHFGRYFKKVVGISPKMYAA